MPGFDDGAVRGLPFQAAIVVAVCLWLALGAAVVLSIYARNAVIAAIGLPATLALVVVYLLPLTGVYVYADRLQTMLSSGST